MRPSTSIVQTSSLQPGGRLSATLPECRQYSHLLSQVEQVLSGIHHQEDLNVYLHPCLVLQLP